MGLVIRNYNFCLERLHEDGTCCFRSARAHHLHQGHPHYSSEVAPDQRPTLIVDKKEQEEFLSEVMVFRKWRWPAGREARCPAIVSSFG